MKLWTISSIQMTELSSIPAVVEPYWLVEGYCLTSWQLSFPKSRKLYLYSKHWERTPKYSLTWMFLPSHMPLKMTPSSYQSDQICCQQSTDRQSSWHIWMYIDVLIDFLEPETYAFETLAISNVIDNHDAMSSSTLYRLFTCSMWRWWFWIDLVRRYPTT